MLTFADPRRGSGRPARSGRRRSSRSSSGCARRRSATTTRPSPPTTGGAPSCSTPPTAAPSTAAPTASPASRRPICRPARSRRASGSTSPSRSTSGTAVVHRDGVPIATQARPAPARGVDRHAPRHVGARVADPGRRRRAPGVGPRPAGRPRSPRRCTCGRAVTSRASSPAGRSTKGTGTVVHDRTPHHLDGTATAHDVDRGRRHGARRSRSAVRQPAPAVRIAGGAACSLGGPNGRSRATSPCSPTGSTLDGDLDVFGDSTLLSVRGHVAGAIDREHFRLDGQADVALEGLHLAAMTVCADRAAAGAARRMARRPRHRPRHRRCRRPPHRQRFDHRRLPARRHPARADGADPEPAGEGDRRRAPVDHRRRRLQRARPRRRPGCALDGNVGFLVDGRRRTFHLRLSAVPGRLRGAPAARRRLRAAAWHGTSSRRSTRPPATG